MWRLFIIDLQQLQAWVRWEGDDNDAKREPADLATKYFRYLNRLYY